MDKFNPDDVQIVPLDKQGRLADMQDKELDFYNSPLVYILNDKKSIYIGETVSILTRLADHNANDVKKSLIKRHAIHSSLFNKSVTLHLESFLINHFSAEKSLRLLNLNPGNSGHYYYSKKEYEWLFPLLWERLQKLNIAKTSFEQIINSDIFKYSPYKSLNVDQQEAVISILKSLIADRKGTFVQGTAGTGKTIIATYLIKLLTTPIRYFESYEIDDEFSKTVYDLLMVYRAKHGITEENEAQLKDQVALVISMTALRNTLRTVFSSIDQLKSSMVISPTDISKRKYKIVLVDEAHRLRQRQNLSGYGDFDKSNQRVGLDKEEGTELDWILKQSDHQIFFYDYHQSIRPTDLSSLRFADLEKSDSYESLQLHTQVRSKGGNLFTDFIHRLFEMELDNQEQFISDEFELKLYDSFVAMREKIFQREDEAGLARLVAGYSWEYKTKAKKNRHLIDMTIEGVDLRWNSTMKDWINSKNAINEVGCIHTVFGKDLNYIAIVFGYEIDYDPQQKKIIIHRDRYKDINGKNKTDDENLEFYIKNIYKTLMLRAIKGVYIYVCNPLLHEYLAQHMEIIPRGKAVESRKPPISDIPTANAVPFYDIKAAAGYFSEEQVQEEEGVHYIQLPVDVRYGEDLFACEVVGESMNKIIPNGSVCLFRKYNGGSRNGKVVLAAATAIQDADFGSNYTIKEYNSKKIVHEEGWQHEEIILSPLSYDEDYKPIVLKEDALTDFKVIAVFERILQ